MDRKYKKLGLVALLVASFFSVGSSLSGSPKSLENFSRYEKEIFVERRGIIEEGFDTDRDEKEDLRFVYSLVSIKDKKAQLKLDGVAIDANRNGHMEENEFIWKRESGKKCPEEYTAYMHQILTNDGGYIIQAFDTDNDSFEDLRFVYSLKEILGDMAFLELTDVMEDKNRNNTYEGNEFVWEKGEEMQIPVLNPPFL